MARSADRKPSTAVLCPAVHLAQPSMGGRRCRPPPGGSGPLAPLGSRTPGPQYVKVPPFSGGRATRCPPHAPQRRCAAGSPPAADGDGAAEQTAVAALHMDKLIRPLGLHPLGLQGEGPGKFIEAHRLCDGTELFVLAWVCPPSVSLVYWMAINRQISSRMAMAAARAASW